MSEVLIVLDESGASRDEVVSGGSVSHAISERVFVLRGGSGQVAGLEGVERVFTGAEKDPELPRGLSPAEVIFVKGWLSRASKTAERPGDGVDWDAPGFKPPR